MGQYALAVSLGGTSKNPYFCAREYCQLFDFLLLGNTIGTVLVFFDELPLIQIRRGGRLGSARRSHDWADLEREDLKRHANYEIY